MLSLVHSNMCGRGPMEEASLGDNKYFVTFIDKALEKVLMYILKIKD